MHTPLRCQECGRLLGYVDGKASIKCPRCGAVNTRKVKFEDEVTELGYKGK